MEEVEQLCDCLTIMDKGKELIIGTSEEIKGMCTFGEVVELEVFDLPEAILMRVKGMADVRELFYQSGQLTVHFGKGDNHLLPLLQLLEETGSTILNLTIKKPTLNDVFLEITGKELRDHA